MAKFKIIEQEEDEKVTNLLNFIKRISTADKGAHRVPPKMRGKKVFGDLRLGRNIFFVG
jgi:hypothetical protein